MDHGSMAAHLTRSEMLKEVRYTQCRGWNWWWYVVECEEWVCGRWRHWLWRWRQWHWLV